MTVFVAFNCAGSFNEFAGVFSSRELADRWVKSVNGEEFIVIREYCVNSLLVANATP